MHLWMTLYDSVCQCGMSGVKCFYSMLFFESLPVLSSHKYNIHVYPLEKMFAQLLA